MEWFWIIVSSALAGVGTGLVGLSAATVMVPMLIVLCPSFSNETGAYQATAIALASDILGSAVTTYIYYKHKNIDLRRGWIMLVCIVTMCTVGSYAAWLAGNVVLGGFTLFLTFFIGIRFLVKPDTQKDNTVDKGTSLDLKGILISLFFGLTIGFGTGFVGTGGGMMMLVVFTVFLGMDRRSAVGTSTFIMTFTALIASISHILIHPAIISEKLVILLICIIVTTAFSLISAQFANKVNNKLVGIVTGIILTLLGAFLIVLNYWDSIQNFTIIYDVLICLGKYLCYIIPVAVTLIIIKFLFKIPREVFRKMLHAAAFTSSAVIVYHADNWLIASLTLIIFAIIVYPILKLFEHWKGYDDLFIQRKTGEIKKSLLLLFISNAIFIAISWGIFDLPHIAIVSIFMWGFGDAAAALIGKRYGKHHVHIKFADEKKTWEGTCAMFVTACVIGTLYMTFISIHSLGISFIFSCIASIFGAYTELITHNGDDTVTVPAVNIIILLILHLFI